jgi:UDP-glucose 4-epimerase
LYNLKAAFCQAGGEMMRGREVAMNLCKMVVLRVVGRGFLGFSGRSVKEFVEACIKATGVNMTVSYLERRAGDYAEVYSDSSKIQRELNWTAQHLDLTETLNVAWKWRQAHPNGY